MLDTIVYALYKRLCTVAVSIDYSKAFDRIQRQLRSWSIMVLFILHFHLLLSEEYIAKVSVLSLGVCYPIIYFFKTKHFLVLSWISFFYLHIDLFMYVRVFATNRFF